MVVQIPCGQSGYCPHLRSQPVRMDRTTTPCDPGVMNRESRDHITTWWHSRMPLAPSVDKRQELANSSTRRSANSVATVGCVRFRLSPCRSGPVSGRLGFRICRKGRTTSLVASLVHSSSVPCVKGECWCGSQESSRSQRDEFARPYRP